MSEFSISLDELFSLPYQRVEALLNEHFEFKVTDNGKDYVLTKTGPDIYLKEANKSFNPDPNDFNFNIADRFKKDPDYGPWKLHCSVKPKDMAKASKIIFKLRTKYNIKVKTTIQSELANRNGTDNRIAQGRFITIYLPDNQPADKIVRMIEKEFSSKGISPGVEVVTDRKVGKYTYYRYGGDTGGIAYVGSVKGQHKPENVGEHKSLGMLADKYRKDNPREKLYYYEAAQKIKRSDPNNRPRAKPKKLMMIEIYDYKTLDKQSESGVAFDDFDFKKNDSKSHINITNTNKKVDLDKLVSNGCWEVTVHIKNKNDMLKYLKYILPDLDKAGVKGVRIPTDANYDKFVSNPGDPSTYGISIGIIVDSKNNGKQITDIIRKKVSTNRLAVGGGRPAKNGNRYPIAYVYRKKGFKPTYDVPAPKSMDRTPLHNQNLTKGKGRKFKKYPQKRVQTASSVRKQKGNIASQLGKRQPSKNTPKNKLAHTLGIQETEERYKSFRKKLKGFHEAASKKDSKPKARRKSQLKKQRASRASRTSIDSKSRAVLIDSQGTQSRSKGLSSLKAKNPLTNMGGESQSRVSSLDLRLESSIFDGLFDEIEEKQKKSSFVMSDIDIDALFGKSSKYGNQSSLEMSGNDFKTQTSFPDVPQKTGINTMIPDKGHVSPSRTRFSSNSGRASWVNAIAAVFGPKVAGVFGGVGVGDVIEESLEFAKNWSDEAAYAGAGGSGAYQMLNALRAIAPKTMGTIENIYVFICKYSKKVILAFKMSKTSRFVLKAVRSISTLRLLMLAPIGGSALMVGHVAVVAGFVVAAHYASSYILEYLGLGPVRGSARSHVKFDHKGRIRVFYSSLDVGREGRPYDIPPDVAEDSVKLFEKFYGFEIRKVPVNGRYFTEEEYQKLVRIAQMLAIKRKQVTFRPLSYDPAEIKNEEAKRKYHDEQAKFLEEKNTTQKDKAEEQKLVMYGTQYIRSVDMLNAELDSFGTHIKKNNIDKLSRDYTSSTYVEQYCYILRYERKAAKRLHIFYYNLKSLLSKIRTSLNMIYKKVGRKSAQDRKHASNLYKLIKKNLSSKKAHLMQLKELEKKIKSILKNMEKNHDHYKESEHLSSVDKKKFKKAYESTKKKAGSLTKTISILQNNYKFNTVKEYVDHFELENLRKYLARKKKTDVLRAYKKFIEIDKKLKSYSNDVEDKNKKYMDQLAKMKKIIEDETYTIVSKFDYNR